MNNRFPDWLAKTHDPIDEHGNLFHVFLSYKSEDSDLVRTVAEWLISAGLRVWFAEYQILLHDRDQFQKHIDIGVAKSKWGIAFTNPTYIDSEHCQNELKSLASTTGCTADHLLEVVLGDRPAAKAFLAKHQLPWLTTPHLFTNLPELCEWLNAQLTHTALNDPIKTAPSGTTVHQGMNGSYSIDLSAWRETSAEQGWQPSSVFKGPQFTLLTDNKVYGDLTIASVRGVDRKSMQYGTEVSFQRNYFNALIDFAKNEYEDSTKKCVGVHLIHKDENVHFATTSFSSGEWVREYFIELPDAYGNGIELALRFRRNGAFHEFVRNIPAMDAMATSVWFDSTLRYVTVIDLAARASISQTPFGFSWASPIGWRRTGQKVTKQICNVDFRPAFRSFWRRLWDWICTRRDESVRQQIRRKLFKRKDLLNLQVHPKPNGFGLEQLEKRVKHTIAANGGKITFHLNGNRHGERTYECLYQWRRRGHTEYGFQVHFILGNQIFSAQINSLAEITKGDERLILASAFADCIRVPEQHHEPDRRDAARTTNDRESAAASHYRAIRMSVGPPHCHLRLAAAEPEGPNVYLAYRWSENLTHEQADQVDTCVRALVNSKIGDIANQNDISVRLAWGEESLLGIPIPLWFLDHRNQATYVVNSQFDVDQKVISLTVGTRFVPVGPDDDMHDPTSIGLYQGFMSLLTEIEIRPLT
jgi:hypothetical protein